MTNEKEIINADYSVRRPLLANTLWWEMARYINLTGRLSTVDLLIKVDYICNIKSSLFKIRNTRRSIVLGVLLK
jgi:hypothetical protein